MEINISPSEIREKDFSRGFSGYKKSEVKLFLDEIATQFESMFAQIKKFGNQIDRQKQELQKVDEQKELLKRTLILAEKLKDETLSSAKNEAQNIIKDAEITSREKLKKAKDYLSILEHDYINLKERKKHFIIALKTKINYLLDSLDEFEESPEKEKSKEKNENQKQISTDNIASETNDKENNQKIPEDEN